jgi:hypothetical protein
MVDFEAVIRHFGPLAVALQLSEAETDRTALEAIKNKLSAGQPARVSEVRSWLRAYEVFQGIDSLKRTAITEAVLLWADAQDELSNMRTLDALVEAHRELMDRCCIAYGAPRDFTSLASKALWLRYPDTVPLFDSFAKRALWVISKIESDIAPPAQEKSEYRKFAYVWKTLYERYASTIATVDVQGYPYRVRIFDKILWIIGTPAYTYGAHI